MINENGDILLEHTDDGGEINIVNGVMEMTTGLRTGVYLSLFGGNETGRWWGDSIEKEPSAQYPCETQKLLDTLPATPANIRAIELAATKDLSWLISNGYAEKVDVNVTITAPKKIKMVINIGTSDFVYYESWEN